MNDSEQRRKDAIGRLRSRRDFVPHLVSYVVVNGFFVLIWALTGGGYFWPAWLLGLWGIGLVMHAYTAFVQKPITEEEIQREMERGQPSATDLTSRRM
jgi:vacuolar-type H+-ATPase subunit I/STV1